MGRMRPTNGRVATALLPRWSERRRKSLHDVRSRSHLCARLPPAQRDFSRCFAGCASSGGGGNRTRVRGRTGQSVYKRRLPSKFARRLVGSRPTDGLAILKCRAAGDWLSLGAEPDSWRPCPDLGPSQEGRRYLSVT
jgi:hypothetical protein